MSEAGWKYYRRLRNERQRKPRKPDPPGA